MRRCNARRLARPVFLLFLAALLVNILTAAEEPGAGVLDSGMPAATGSGAADAQNVILHLDTRVHPIRIPAGAGDAYFQAAMAPIKTIRGYAGGGYTYVDCPVKWDLSAIDRSVPGIYPVKGQVAPPPGFAFSADLMEDAKASLAETRIYVYREGIRRVTRLIFYQCFPGTPLLAVSTGTPNLAEKLDKSFDYKVELDSFEKVRVDHAWDFSSVDGSAPGLYTATLCLIPPAPDIEIPEDFQRLPVQVLVQKPGEPNLVALAEYNGYFCMPVILTQGEHRRLQVWYRINGGEWVKEDWEKGGVYFNSTTPFEFRFQKEHMRPGNTYAFKVALDGYTSDILEITASENQFTAAILGDRDGQRDETGRKEHPLPPLRQPPPVGSKEPAGNSNKGTRSNDGGPEVSAAISAPESGPVRSLRPEKEPPAVSCASEAHWEEVTPERTSLVGKRLEKLLEYNEGQLLFEKHGITVQIPASWLAGLQMSDSSLLSVMITPLDERSFRLALTVDGEPPPSLPIFQISMPYGAEQHGTDRVAVFDGHGDALTDAAYDAKTGRVTFSVGVMGIFHVGPWQTLPPPELANSLCPNAVQISKSTGREAARITGVMLLLGSSVCPLIFVLIRKRGHK